MFVTGFLLETGEITSLIKIQISQRLLHLWLGVAIKSHRKKSTDCHKYLDRRKAIIAPLKYVSEIFLLSMLLCSSDVAQCFKQTHFSCSQIFPRKQRFHHYPWAKFSRWLRQAPLQHHFASDFYLFSSLKFYFVSFPKRAEQHRRVLKLQNCF